MPTKVLHEELGLILLDFLKNGGALKDFQSSDSPRVLKISTKELVNLEKSLRAR